MPIRWLVELPLGQSTVISMRASRRQCCSRAAWNFSKAAEGYADSWPRLSGTLLARLERLCTPFLTQCLERSCPSIGVGSAICIHNAIKTC